MSDEYGRIVSVGTRNLGESISANASSGATTIFVEDASTFSELGGFVVINDVTYAYSSRDTTLNTITLTTGLTASVTADEDRVEVYPTKPIKRALVDLASSEGDAVYAVVPHDLAAVLADGFRDESNREDVLIEERGVGELHLKDVIASPTNAGNDTGWISTVSDVIVAAANWTIPLASVRKIGNIVFVAIVFQRATSSLAVNDSASSVANTDVGTMAAPWRPPAGFPVQSLHTGPGDRLAAFTIDPSTGKIQLIAAAPAASIAVGDQIDAGGCYCV
jgi:hypothetical protein